MNNQPAEGNMPDEIDFTKAARGLHHIPASIERSVCQYFFAKSQEKHVPMSDLVTKILRRDMETNQVSK